MKELEVIGNPEMCVIAFRSVQRGLDIYKINDLMTQRGWHLNALQNPASIHVCFTAQHTEAVDQLLQV